MISAEEIRKMRKKIIMAEAIAAIIVTIVAVVVTDTAEPIGGEIGTIQIPEIHAPM